MENQQRAKKYAENATDPKLATADMADSLSRVADALEKPEAESTKPVKVSIEGAEIITIKGEKGDKGETGDKGDKGDPGKNGKDGKDGKNGLNGKDGKDGLDGDDGLNGTDGKEGLNGKDGSPDTGTQIVEKINSLDPENSDEQIDAVHIKNLPKEVKKHTFAVQRNIAWYDETTLLIENPTKIKFAGAGVQATVDNEGSVIITVSGGASANESNGETLTPVNGTTFTFAHAPTAGGVRNVWIAETGQLLTPTTDYSVSGSTLTTVRDQTGSTLISNYTY